MGHTWARAPWMALLSAAAISGAHAHPATSNANRSMATTDVALLTQGIRKHLALSGFRRMGKTVILREFLRRHLLPGLDAPVAVAYLDLPCLAFTPESFDTQYIGATLYWLAVLQRQSRVCYVVAGSMLRLMERLFLGADSPLFVHFQMETVGPFGRDDSYGLARRRL